MGTYIYLKVGGAEIDWSKNFRGSDHGALFQDCDQVRAVSDEKNGCKDAKADDSVTELNERALIRKLKFVVPRLELLGVTTDAAKTEYELAAEEWAEGFTADQDFKPPLGFSEFVAFLSRHPLGELDEKYVDISGSEALARIQSRFVSDPAFDRIPYWDVSGDGYSEVSYFASLIAILPPYSILRLLALVPENLELDVAWEYGEMVDSGWACEEDFVPCARRAQTFLVATEGTSDIFILKQAISLLMPSIADFFRFIDVSERHPFSGAGSLVNFAEGLAKIDVQNQVIFLFDNDAEGWAAYERVRSFVLPANMRAIVLPDIDDFRAFPAAGPGGVVLSDINRRAAGIECYLDLRLEGMPPAQILWTNYKKERNDYQGSLEHKDSYVRAFSKVNRETLKSGTYDLRKLQMVLDRIVRECVSIARGSQMRGVS